jgi:hypothetical protein
MWASAEPAVANDPGVRVLTQQQTAKGNYEKKHIASSRQEALPLQ